MGLCVAKNLPLRGELLCLVSLVWKAAFQTGLVTGCLMALMVLSSVVKLEMKVKAVMIMEKVTDSSEK